MFIGKWNKSVILTYVGLIISIFGMYIAKTYNTDMKYAYICLIFAGICDMFDGFVARKCKRTEEEKNFGVELDSLVDVISFVVLPIIIMLCMGLDKWYDIIIFALYAICGVARLGYFNILVADASNPVKYYYGMPVTFVALIYPIFFILTLFVNMELFKVLLAIITFAIAALFVLKIKIKKPKGVSYVFYSALAIIVTLIYMFAL